MNKMEYQKPWAEFVQFDNEDVITASGQEIECPDNAMGGSGEVHAHLCGGILVFHWWWCNLEHPCPLWINHKSQSRNTLTDDGIDPTQFSEDAQGLFDLQDEKWD